MIHILDCLLSKTWKWYTYVNLPRLHSLQFSFQNEVHVHFAWNQNEIIITQNKNFNLLQIWNELISEWLVRKWNLTLYHVNRHRELCGDGMNLFQNENHSENENHLLNLLFGQKRSTTKYCNVFDFLVHTRTSDHVQELYMCP